MSQKPALMSRNAPLTRLIAPEILQSRPSMVDRATSEGAGEAVRARRNVRFSTSGAADGLAELDKIPLQSPFPPQTPPSYPWGGVTQLYPGIKNGTWDLGVFCPPKPNTMSLPSPQ